MAPSSPQSLSVGCLTPVCVDIRAALPSTCLSRSIPLVNPPLPASYRAALRRLTPPPVGLLCPLLQHCTVWLGGGVWRGRTYRGRKKTARCFPSCVSRHILFRGQLRFCSFAHSMKGPEMSRVVLVFYRARRLETTASTSVEGASTPATECLHAW